MAGAIWFTRLPIIELDEISQWLHVRSKSLEVCCKPKKQEETLARTVPALP